MKNKISNILLTIITIILLSIVVYLFTTSKPKKPKKVIFYHSVINQNDEIYNISMKYLKNCNFGSNNPNRLNTNTYFYQTNHNIKDISLEQQFVCSLQFIKDEDLDIKIKFDRRQLNTHISRHIIESYMKNVFGTLTSTKQNFESIYLDKLDVFCDIIYNPIKDAYQFKAKELENIQEINILKLHTKYLQGEYKSIDNKEQLIFKEKFVFYTKNVNNKIDIYKDFNKKHLLISVSEDKIKETLNNYVNKGSDITFIFTRDKNNHWYYESSIIKE